MKLKLRNSKSKEEVKFVDVEECDNIILIKVDDITIFKLYKDMSSAIAFPQRALAVGFGSTDFV